MPLINHRVGVGENTSTPVLSRPVSTVGMDVGSAQFVQSDSTVNPNNYDTEFNGAATTTIPNNLQDILVSGEDGTTGVLSEPANTDGMDVGSDEFVQSDPTVYPNNNYHTEFNGAATTNITNNREDTLVFGEDGTTRVLSEPITDGMNLSDEFVQSDTTVNLNNTSNGVATRCIAKPFIIIVCFTLMMQ